VTAASSADAAVVLVDATKLKWQDPGLELLPQTRRHTLLAKLLRVPAIVFAVNKMDLVGHAKVRFDRIAEDFAMLAGTLPFDEVRAIPMSALHGDMVVERGEALRWYDGPTLLTWLEMVPARHDEGAASTFRFPVQRVTRVSGPNGQSGWNGGELRGYQGTVASGTIAVGDSVVVAPSGLSATVARILTPDGDLDVARADRAVTLCLDRELDISRGEVLASTGEPPRVASEFDAEVCWFDAEPLVPARTYLLKQGAQLVKARFAAIGARVDVDTMQRAPAPATLAMNDIAYVQLETRRPLAIDAYAENRVTGAFIVIDEVSNRTMAAGTIG